MIIHGIICPKCKDFIFSRAGHDFHQCSCGDVFIDGGFDYMRYGGMEGLVLKEIELDVTEKELYEDWAKGIDKYGLIKNFQLLVKETIEKVEKCQTE
jgi:hypothetical protein